MDLARRFAQPYSGDKVKGRKSEESRAVHYKLDGVAYALSQNGAPILDAAMAWFECQAQEFIPIGDHYLTIGEVIDGAMLKEAEPMTSSYTGWTYSG